MNVLDCVLNIANRISLKISKDYKEIFNDICRFIPENQHSIEIVFRDLFETLKRADEFFQKDRDCYTTQIDPTNPSHKDNVSGILICEGIFNIVMKESFKKPDDTLEHFNSCELHYLHLTQFISALIRATIDRADFSIYEKTCILSKSFSGNIPEGLQTKTPEQDTMNQLPTLHFSSKKDITESNMFREILYGFIPELEKTPALIKGLISELKQEYSDLLNSNNNAELIGLPEFLMNWRSQHKDELGIILH